MDEEFKRDRAEDLAIFKKGKEIFDVVHRIGELIPEDDDYLQHLRGCMIADAALLTVKVAGAEAGDLYDIRMEAAAIIRKAAKDLMLNQHSLEGAGFSDAGYYTIVRSLLEEYRLLFIAWVQSFDPWNYYIDRWGLFNPPGVGPFDHDPDDDIPWEGPDSLDS
jgi:hypothetical protein